MAGVKIAYKGICTNNNVRCSFNSLVGDTNGDGEITLADANLVSDVYFRRKAEPSNICCLDANGDGDITPIDVQYITNYLYEKWKRNRHSREKMSRYKNQLIGIQSNRIGKNKKPKNGHKKAVFLV